MASSSRPAALIVEDQPFVGMVASDILRESGFATFHAYDADEALQQLRDHPEIDVVLTEMELPGDVDGIQLAHWIARERPATRLVVASDGSERRLADLPRGARVIRKPFASAELSTLVCGMTLLQDA
jgi:CheY-like chemotaxis protein